MHIPRHTSVHCAFPSHHRHCTAAVLRNLRVPELELAVTALHSSVSVRDGSVPLSGLAVFTSIFTPTPNSPAPGVRACKCCSCLPWTNATHLLRGGTLLGMSQSPWPSVCCAAGPCRGTAGSALTRHRSPRLLFYLPTTPHLPIATHRRCTTTDTAARQPFPGVPGQFQ
ncbi:uncharacterized protein B0I36DRAFT_136873 [Microdochium trichocladiopsis]|uniref:Uncharacterized protein n=1 Tax=Microdochium trichocladiopsis TaxID=1682393 RepID=A0A9P8Y143_9PEZI|nr:uncharacterized protein B0I36DRAFT_136873 [Microdochium trichocladiopsis]KAH7027272.1 hypothetical protein B0I36DRAFT_136873 [Microdochium trichocladiopsis]